VSPHPDCKKPVKKVPRLSQNTTCPHGYLTTRVNKTKRCIPGVDLRVRHVLPRGPHNTSIIIVSNWSCAKNRHEVRLCVYVCVSSSATHPLRSIFTVRMEAIPSRRRLTGSQTSMNTAIGTCSSSLCARSPLNYCGDPDGHEGLYLDLKVFAIVQASPGAQRSWTRHDCCAHRCLASRQMKIQGTFS
jgi:hypothetical protein